MLAETFTTNSDDFKPTRYMATRNEVSRKTVKLGHLMAGLVFVPGDANRD